MPSVKIYPVFHPDKAAKMNTPPRGGPGKKNPYATPNSSKKSPGKKKPSPHSSSIGARRSPGNYAGLYAAQKDLARHIRKLKEHERSVGTLFTKVPKNSEPSPPSILDSR